MKYLRVKNWDEFQHYKDRNPPWIKLHVSLLDDYEFSSLPDIDKGHLMMIWLFASKNDGRVPNDPRFLQKKLGLEKAPNLEVLFADGWLVDDEEEAPREKWASRYVSELVRASVMHRCGGKCQSCNSKDFLEIDHIVPVSKGGTGDESNLQVLCRSCNRKKRVRSMHQLSAEQVATQTEESSVAQRQRQSQRERQSQRREEAVSLIDFLNSKAGRNYAADGANLDFVLARLKEGATVEDCRAVIAKKCREWLGDEKMNQYLRPATLFNREKFASYKGELSAPEPALRLAV